MLQNFNCSIQINSLLHLFNRQSCQFSGYRSDTKHKHALPLNFRIYVDVTGLHHMSHDCATHPVKHCQWLFSTCIHLNNYSKFNSMKNVYILTFCSRIVLHCMCLGRFAEGATTSQCMVHYHFLTFQCSQDIMGHLILTLHNTLSTIASKLQLLLDHRINYIVHVCADVHCTHKVSTTIVPSL